MAVRTSEAEWQGGLTDGKGIMKLGSGAFHGAYSFSSRFEEGTGTNPEELIGAAHAGCFSMAFANMLTKAGNKPKRIHTVAKVYLEKVGEGFKITHIDLNTEAEVAGIDKNTFLQLAEKAKTGCPISQALGAVEIRMEARLLG
jgi:osmotically inducible protein OsmC